MVFIFILYLIIVYFTQFSPLLSELNPSAEHSVHFENYPTSLLWYSSEILYTPFWRTEIDPIRSSLSAVCNIPHTIEGYSYHQFFHLILIAVNNQFSIWFIPISPSAYPIYPFIVWRNNYHSIETVYNTVYSHLPISRAYFPLIVQRNYCH